MKSPESADTPQRKSRRQMQLVTSDDRVTRALRRENGRLPHLIERAIEMRCQGQRQ